jgi:hypothetical protein
MADAKVQRARDAKEQAHWQDGFANGRFYGMIEAASQILVSSLPDEQDKKAVCLLVAREFTQMVLREITAKLWLHRAPPGTLTRPRGPAMTRRED